MFSVNIHVCQSRDNEEPEVFQIQTLVWIEMQLLNELMAYLGILYMFRYDNDETTSRILKI